MTENMSHIYKVTKYCRRKPYWR